MRLATPMKVRIAYALSMVIIVSGIIAIITFTRSRSPVPSALVLMIGMALGCGGSVLLRAATPTRIRIAYCASTAAVVSAIYAIHYFDHVSVGLAWTVSVALAVGGSISALLSYRYLSRRIDEVRGVSALRRRFFWVCAVPLTTLYCLAFSTLSLFLSVGFFVMGCNRLLGRI